MIASILDWIGNYVSYFPLVVFIGLFLGGFNLPISEDALVIMSAVMCQSQKASIPAFLLALYFGAVLSDYMVYFWGRLIGRGTLSSGLFSKVINKDNTYRLMFALQRYGVFTYIVTRFIPFGVRNVVSMTTGFVNFPFIKFAIYDAIAALCNISALFFFVYFFGSAGSHAIKIIGILFFLVFLGVIFYLIRSKKLSTLIDKKLNEQCTHTDKRE